MEFINSRLSALPNSGKRIVYLITENREILSEIFFYAKSTLKALCRYKDYHQWSDEKFYSACINNYYLQDIYEVLELSEDYFHTYDEDAEVEKGAYFYMTDFHILNQSTAENVLKQFIAYAQLREKINKPVFLFLVSPILQIPLGFQNEMEIIDVNSL